MSWKLPSALRRGSQETLREVAARYGYALLIVAVTVLVRFLVDPILEGTGFAVFLIGILAAAWVGGVVPGLLCQTLILVAQALWFASDNDARERWTLQDVIGLAAFYSVGGLVGALSQASRVARRRAKAEADEANSQREQLHTTIGCVADGVLVTDAAGRVTLMNPVAEAMTGWSLEESKGKPVRDVFSVYDEREREAVENPAARVLREGRVLQERMKMFLTTRHGHRLPIAISAAPIRDPKGRVSGVVLILRDETERHRTEEALLEADRRKDEFLATLAHELRNPLAPICMGLELMKHSMLDHTAAEDVRAMMERQSSQMVRLIDDLLDVSRISRGKLELRKSPVELGDVVRNALDATRPAIEQAKHQLVVSLPEQPVLIYVDPNRMTQVLSNLLNNAAKYTPPGGIVELAAEEDNGEVLITVSDTGVGIPADMRELIFEMFTQVRDMESGHKGLGIGLTLVKRLVEMHGGTVEVESEGRNQGSRFFVRLPAMLQPAPSAPSADGSGSIKKSASRRRVLLVDDNEDALQTLSMLVNLMGHETCEARDGREAVAAAARFQPDVILMDIGMPNVNGYEAAQRIRAESWGRDVLLVATTGWGQEEDRQRTKAAGFDQHLVKPIEHSMLAAIFEMKGRMQTATETATIDLDRTAVAPRSANAAGTHRAVPK